MCLTNSSLSVLRKVPNLPVHKGPSTQELSAWVWVNGNCSTGFGASIWLMGTLTLWVWLAGNAGMEKNMEATIMGCIG